jgi:uncharacterized protein YjbJ (UPF0337 family)
MGEFIDKIKGRAKQTVGKLTGNKARQAEGVADELKGAAKGAFEEVKADVKRSLREIEERRQVDNPGPRGRTRP